MGLKYLVFKTRGKNMQSLGTYSSTKLVLLWLSFSKLIHTGITEIINT